jgi:hypothetical protein
MFALNTNATILRNRNELKSLFKNNRQLSESHFAALIESMLNKRDDQFHGVWKAGRTYRLGDVVIYQGALWEMTVDGEICAKSDAPPSKDNPNWKSLIVPVEDNDWEVIAEEGVMWAKVFDKIGIGIGSYSSETSQSERPEARLDVRKQGQSRWLLFPENCEQTQFTLLHYESTHESSYLVTGISLEEVNWLTDAAKGFVFRKGNPMIAETDAPELEPTTGQVLMVIKPKRIQGGKELATLGLNVEDPIAMLEITDGNRGQLLFTPDEKCDPALSIVNLDPKCEKNYVAIGVGKDEAALVSDAPNGFVFRRGGEYGEYCHEKNINQGNFLAIIRQHPEQVRPQVGIGAAYPQARLDIKDDEQSQVQILPDRLRTEADTEPREAAPVISILNAIATNQPTYLTSGLDKQNQIAGWVSNAKYGFVFRQGGLAIDANQHQLNQGQTHLAIRENGYIGMGTESPYTNLDIVNKSSSGKFLFNLDKKVNPALGILNLRPDTKNNYFTVGADNNHAILITDSQYGFLFKFGVEFGTNDSQIDINQGFTLLSMRPDGKDSDKNCVGIVSIRPEGKGRLGIGKQPMDYELDVRGMTRTFTVYQDTNSNQIINPKPLKNVLEKIKLLQPVTFYWNRSTGFADMGEQIGLLAHVVDDVFPQVVKTSSDGTQAVAYQNLVPVLIQAINEILTERDQTRQELQTLRDEFTVYQHQMEERLQELTNSIARCEPNI